MLPLKKQSQISTANLANLDLEEEILKLKKSLNAVILSHYYQDLEIQDIADFIGDSLDLSRKAAATDADVIVFCGVKFMAEVAKILSPNKKVLIPDYKAGCSLEDSCKPESFAEFRRKHPDHIALTYINCSAEVKALSDIIVTSTNAKKIIDQIPKDQPIIFAPDRHLGRYLSKETGRDMLLWQGSCIVHEQFSEKELVKLITNHPNAKIIAHPECPENLLNYAHHIGSTSSLLAYSSKNQGGEFIVLTEPSMIHQMQQKNPTAKFYSCPFVDSAGCVLCNTCPYMQLNTLEKVYLVMLDLANNSKNSLYGGELILDEDLRKKSEIPLRKMLAMS
jgi:quinolinate synthase